MLNAEFIMHNEGVAPRLIKIIAKDNTAIKHYAFNK